MTSLLESLTWWPWHTEAGIHNVRRAPQAPGMVTLAWATQSACPTVLTKRDGAEVYRDEIPRREHHVTLTGWVGYAEDIVILAADGERIVEVSF